jgi:uncharacterized membrane protein
VLVVILGSALRRPLVNIPENTLKFVVGVLLSSFGTFWVGEGMGLYWPGADWSVGGLIAGYWIAGLLSVSLFRKRANSISTSNL